MRKRWLIAGLCLAVCVCLVSASLAETLRSGMKGEEVQKLQKTLIEYGYLSGKADGVFGSRTEAAVRAFQKRNGLKADGLAGTKTQAKLQSGKAKTAAVSEKTEKTQEKKQGSGIFGGDYSTISNTSEPNRIRTLQKALIALNYLKGSADGVYGTVTKAAVKAFQQGNGLKGNGIAEQKTLMAIEEAKAAGKKAVNALDEAEPLPKGAGKIKAPAKSDVQLLHWYEDVKPALKKQEKITVYEPESGLGWTLVVRSGARHCDAEPATIRDTQIMMKAFGNQNTWKQKGVYVKLPDGRWTVGATHTAPHLTDSIKDNGFDGILSVHFFRDLEECTKMDPNYGVSNQRTIRSLWRKVSGEIVN